jgi:transposase-like protein
VQCFLSDFEACIAHLKFPVAHRKVIRTTNLLERLFEEERRRTKIIPDTFSERPVLKLMFAALIRTSESWRGIHVTAFESKQCEAIRKELDTEYSRRHASPVTQSRGKREGGSSARISSRSRT